MDVFHDLNIKRRTLKSKYQILSKIIRLQPKINIIIFQNWILRNYGIFILTKTYKILNLTLCRFKNNIFKNWKLYIFLTV